MTVLSSKKPSRTIVEKEKFLKMMQEPTADELKRVNANIPHKLHNELKMYAAMDRKEIREVLIDLIRDYIKSARRRHAPTFRELQSELEKTTDENPSKNSL